MRAYLVAGSPKICSSLGSYSAWSDMVRSPLVWLGEPDPVISMEGLRNEDEELSNISEFVQQWLDSGLSLDTNFLLVSIVEEACAPPPPNYYGPQPFKELLLRIAATKNDPGKVSAERLGRWLRRISGRVVSLVDSRGALRKYRLIREPGRSRQAYYKLTEVS